MGWPQYLVAGWLLLSIFASLQLHGQPRDNFNAVHAITTFVLLAALLGAGGFWGVL